MKKTKFMNKVMKKMSKKVAQPPGTLVHMGERKAENVTVTLTRYSADAFEVKKITKPEQCVWNKDFQGVSWVSVCGLHDTATIEAIGNNFEIHPLVQEDILNTLHRPKFEESEDYIFMVLKLLQYDPNTKEIIPEQVSLILGPNFVLSFQERVGDDFDPIRERLQNHKGRFRKMGADYLLYALMDAVVDNYFLVLETLGESLEILEDRLLENPSPEVLQTVHKLKREMIFLRKAVWPLREVIHGLQKTESPLIDHATSLYFRDIYDHTVQVIETTETYRDMVAGLQELYLSGVSNKMNEVMKLLTIIATIFIPLTFIAGVYGMNFEFMPELKWRLGYFIIWGLMIVTGVGMVIYFKKKKWL